MGQLIAIVVGTLSLLVGVAVWADKSLPASSTLRVGNRLSGYYEARRRVVLFGPVAQFFAAVTIATFAIGLRDLTTLTFVCVAVGSLISVLYFSLLVGLFRQLKRKE